MPEYTPIVEEENSISDARVITHLSTGTPRSSSSDEVLVTTVQIRSSVNGHDKDSEVVLPAKGWPLPCHWPDHFKQE